MGFDMVKRVTFENKVMNKLLLKYFYKYYLIKNSEVYDLICTFINIVL